MLPCLHTFFYASCSLVFTFPNFFRQVSRSINIFFNMMRLEDDPIQAHKIPLVNDLCQELGLGGRNSERSIIVRRSLIEWRKYYTTPDGVAGMSITQWQSKLDRYRFGVMALKYLETDGHGRKHWPSSMDALYEYPKDIKE